MPSLTQPRGRHLASRATRRHIDALAPAEEATKPDLLATRTSDEGASGEARLAHKERDGVLLVRLLLDEHEWAVVERNRTTVGSASSDVQPRRPSSSSCRTLSRQYPATELIRHRSIISSLFRLRGATDAPDAAVVVVSAEALCVELDRLAQFLTRHVDGAGTNSAARRQPHHQRIRTDTFRQA